MRKSISTLALLILLVAACGPPEPTTVPTTMPTEPVELPTRMPTLSPTLEVAPEPTAGPPPTPVPTAEPSPTPVPTEVPAEDQLARYAPAMRPAFVDDLAAVGPLSRYRIEVTVDPENAALMGREVVNYVNNDPVPQEAVYFRLFPNLPGYGG